MFSPQAQAVYEDYEARWESEQKLMKELGPKGMGIRDELLLAVGRDVGEFLVTLINGRGAKNIIEVGTSYGYSTLFLAHAASLTGGCVTTLELDPKKQAYAKDHIDKAGLSKFVSFECCDAVQWLSDADGTFDFVLLDVWKELYIPCLKEIMPKLSEEGIIAADNMISPPVHRDMARTYRETVRKDSSLQSVLLPIGSGIELSVKWPEGNEKL